MGARERALKSFLKWMVSLPWHGPPLSSRPSIPSLSPFPIAAAIDESPNGRKRRGTFYIFPYTRDDETRRDESGLWPALNRRRGGGGMAAAFLPSRSHLLRSSSRIQRNFRILIPPKKFFFSSKFIFIQLGQGRKLGRPRNVSPSTRH